MEDDVARVKIDINKSCILEISTLEFEFDPSDLVDLLTECGGDYNIVLIGNEEDDESDEG